MEQSWESPSSRLLALPFHPAVRYAAAWAVALGWSAVALHIAWHNFDQPARRDGNFGHANIDFCGQWLLGRMIVLGYGRQLYDPAVQRRVLEDALPAEDQEPDARESDVERMLGWMVVFDESDSANPPVGGPLYPPVHALLCGPLGLLPPRPAYRLTQLANLGLVFLCGLLIRRLSEGRVWWPVAAVFVLAFPGCGGSINLGQNATLSLALLLAGWSQLREGRPAVAGVAWGLLAFKPVWAVTFLVVPLLTRRWRMAAAMAATGTVLAALTLPVVGWQPWLYWLKIGRTASQRYGEFEVWVILSRDLIGLPRRWLLDFADGVATNADWPLPTRLGVGLWLAAVAGTVLVAWRGRRGEPATEGPAAAFVLLGAWLGCYHFMYYDSLLAALPVCLLLTHPREFLRVRFLGRATTPPPEVLPYYAPRLEEPPPMPLLREGRTPRWVKNSFVLTLLVPLGALPALSFAIDPSGHLPPFETYCLLALWVWCGWKWWRGDREEKPRTAGLPAAKNAGGTVVA
jgi:hypothetical protein